MGKKYTDAQKREMVRRYIGGETLKAIATDIGCSTNTIWKTVNKHFRGELVLEDNHERNDTVSDMTMTNEGKIVVKKETPAAAATATDEKPNVSKYSSYLYDSTQSQFCQALLTQILELADDIIGDETSGAEIAGYAGMIKGLAVALGEVLRE